MKSLQRLLLVSLVACIAACAIYCRKVEPEPLLEIPTAHYSEYRGPDCCWCGSTDELNVHHIKPQHLGGMDDPSNLATFCRNCHFVVAHARNWTNEVRCLRDIIRLRRIDAPER